MLYFPSILQTQRVAGLRRDRPTAPVPFGTECHPHEEDGQQWRKYKRSDEAT